MNIKYIESSADITERETYKIKYVLSKYGKDTITISKTKNNYLISTKDELLCLNKYRHGKYKIKNACLLTEKLLKNEFNNTLKYYKTKHGDFYVRYNKYIYYLTVWYKGEGCNLEVLEDIIKCSELLANFHKNVSFIDISHMKIKKTIKNWPKVIYNYINDLERFNNFIEKKVIKNNFDIIYNRFMDKYSARATNALNLLNELDFYKLYCKANKENNICYNANFFKCILKNDSEYFITELDNIVIDLQLMDLVFFINIIMTKNSRPWDFEKAKTIICSYSLINPLSTQDLQFILAMLLFPYKYWKLGNKRYVKQKKWTEGKYIHKLNKIINNYQLEENFYKNFLDYINNK
jgi:spore coat protein, CotS family